VWVGLLIDGPAKGTFEVERAVFTDEPFRPIRPFRVSGAWDAAQDPAVRGRLTTAEEGPDGGPCMRYAFQLQGGRHMYAIPRVAVNVEELEGYSGLRFTYKADLPQGIPGLLVMLIEADGTQYYADPAPPGSSDWKTVTVPFGRFRRGGWSEDENDRLDLNDVRYVAIGMHGSAKQDAASGTIMVADVELVP
jgi:hypothetical protein